MDYPSDIESYLYDIRTDQINRLAMDGYIILLDSALDMVKLMEHSDSIAELDRRIDSLKLHIWRYKTLQKAMREDMILIYN